MADPKSPPLTYNTATATYFVDNTGTHWRVFDCARVNRRHLILPIGSGRTEYRVFASREGRKLVYFFRPRELRGTRAEHLERQLHESQDLDVTDFDPALEHGA